MHNYSDWELIKMVEVDNNSTELELILASRLKDKVEALRNIQVICEEVESE